MGICLSILPGLKVIDFTWDRHAKKVIQYWTFVHVFTLSLVIAKTTALTIWPWVQIQIEISVAQKAAFLQISLLKLTN